MEEVVEHIDAVIGRIAGQQHGLVTKRQVLDLGATRSVVRRRVARGRWAHVDRGVFQIVGTARTWQSDLLACVLAAGDGAVASHRSAGALWGLDGCWSNQPELTIPNGRRFRREGVRTHESTDLHLVQPILRSGIPTTPVPRTLLDLGAVLRIEQVRLAIDDARRRELVDWDELLTTLVRHARRGRDGVGTLRCVLDDHYGEVAVSDSGFERLVVSALLAGGLPAPVLQHQVRIGGRMYRLDLAYPEARLAIELDGSVHMERDVWEADHARQNALILAGWTLLRFTWNDYREHSGKLIAQVRAALARTA